MRAEDWPRRLDDAVNAARSRAFQWGIHDCCIMAADIVYEITGVDAASGLRGTYSTQEEAAQIIANAGGFDRLIGGICNSNGWKATKPSMARRGDIVIFTSPETNSPALGVCLGSQSCFPSTLGGLAFINTSQCSRAWRID